MGYETKLIIGKSSCITTDEFIKGALVVDDDQVYRPYLKDNKGNCIKSGRKETYFSVYAQIDLCKCGSDSKLHELDWTNKSDEYVWYWYGSDGNTRITEDRYGDKPKPVPINDVVVALEKDLEKSEYRRFNWALSLLRSMQDDPEELEVLLFGH